MSFLLDPPLLVGAGAAIERLVPGDQGRDLVESAVVAVFVGTSVGLYLDVPATRWLWERCGATSGRDWMLNSGVFRFDVERAGTATHTVAALLFGTYPLWCRLGRRLAARRR